MTTQPTKLEEVKHNQTSKIFVDSSKYKIITNASDIPGLILIHDLITSEEETELLKLLKLGKEWKTFGGFSKVRGLKFYGKQLEFVVNELFSDRMKPPKLFMEIGLRLAALIRDYNMKNKDKMIGK